MLFTIRPEGGLDCIVLCCCFPIEFCNFFIADELNSLIDSFGMLSSLSVLIVRIGLRISHQL
jgi:hypothetical protein